MRRPGHHVALSAVALGVTMSILGSGLAACGASTPAAAPVTITVYSGQHQQTTNELVSGFEKATGINVVVRSNDEDTFDQQIVTEGARSPADVFFTENSPALEFLQQKNLLAPLDASTLAESPARLNSPKGDWVAVSARVSVLIYNPSVIKESALPTKVLQLADPKYKGKLAIAPGETDFQPIVTSVLRAYGKAATIKWLEGVKANGAAHDYPDNETIASDVNRGAAAFGLINQYYWYRMQAEIGKSATHSKIAYLTNGDPGYVLDVSGAGVLRYSKHPVAAQKFVAYLVSKAGQEIISHSISFEYPVASGVSTAQPETPFKDLHPNSITIGDLGTGSQAVALLQQAQLL